MRIALTSALILGLCSIFAAEPANAANPYGSCQDVSIPVALAAGQPANQTVAATFCTPATWTSGPHEIDVLVAGATYNRTYWDWPQSPDTYSYVDKTLQAHRATLNFDRLGAGGSSRPDGSQLNITSDAYVLHQVIGWAHAHGYAQVNGVAHSLGSITQTKEAALYQDVQRVVVTGILHLPGIGLNSTGFATSLYPAALDPAFASGGYDINYLTTMPGRRGPDFYDPSTADPNVIAYDEAHKDVATLGEVSASITELETPALLNTTQQITAPVLVVMGEEDDIFCNLTVNCHSADSIQNNEAPYYNHAASLSVATVPDTAHDLTLHPSANVSFNKINDWITAH
jgi:pimeloyl-ACP methyl ester carboxylesterase